MDRSAVMRFGPFAFDRARMVLERDGQLIPVGGRGSALLSALLDAQGQVVTREELLEAGWPGRVVEERNLTVQIANLRQAMGELPNGEEPIRTVSRVGYRLALGARPTGSITILALRPTVVVLPFANLSSDPELAFFADGVTEDLITALSRFRTFAVVARGSSFVYKGHAVAAEEVARTLGVRYLLDGSIRREGHRLRIAAHLADAEQGTLLWADSFEEELGGLFEIQDRITAEVVGRVEPQITQAEVERSRRKHPQNMDAYDHYLLGVALSNRLDTTAALYNRMVWHSDRAVELDPTFPQALISAGWAHELRRMLGDATPPGTDDYAIADDLRGRALVLAPDDALVLGNAGLGFHNFRDDGEGALALAERSVALNPYSDRVLSMAAIIQRAHGRAEEATRLRERCFSLNPASPKNAFVMETTGCCHLADGRYAEAVDSFKQALALGASWDLVLVNLAVAETLLGEMEAAHATLERFLQVRPNATIRGLLERLPPGRRHREERTWPEGLRRVGLPEG